MACLVLVVPGGVANGIFLVQSPTEIMVQKDIFFSVSNMTITLLKIPFFIPFTQEKKNTFSNSLSTSYILLPHHTLEVLHIVFEFEYKNMNYFQKTKFVCIASGIFSYKLKLINNRMKLINNTMRQFLSSFFDFHQFGKIKYYNFPSPISHLHLLKSHH